jgi:hypothetical protein
MLFPQSVHEPLDSAKELLASFSPYAQRLLLHLRSGEASGWIAHLVNIVLEVGNLGIC